MSCARKVIKRGLVNRPRHTHTSSHAQNKLIQTSEFDVLPHMCMSVLCFICNGNEKEQMKQNVQNERHIQRIHMESHVPLIIIVRSYP